MAQQRTMYDSVSWTAIPDSAEAVALYDDGALYATPQAGFDHFAGLGKVIEHITVTGQTLTAKWGDCEWGDLDEAGLADWLRRKAAAGLGQGGGYGSLSRLGSIVAACGRIPLWVAHYTYVPHICAQATCWKDAPNLPADFPWECIVGTQYADRGPNGENVDVSLCGAGWPA